MTAITFDTHEFIKTLVASGIPDAQAEAISRAFRDARHQAEVATKSDLRELEYRLTLRIGALIATAVLIITALDKLL
uniref:DUF1640 domain-containing protein n=1 Tax=Candidatus Kentrum eta TaxID=2126337 RepID=A0A450UZ15_9GAMM|nr:MAG: hypothetical protein BECKH772A_GA0070896_100174 [Candidatus Kentron sp. H]VFJ91254.1 MAG: hypothetical protein BECKH772B_GA0070898_100164 [Candidatus Kentron sp. H]VFJ97798.1 MAG: hypothetical protein BECKH772C_GA0070978_100164 [Candidatus Kentron sp. H]